MTRRILQHITKTGRHLTQHRLAKIALLAFVRGTSGAAGTALVSLLVYWIIR